MSQQPVQMKSTSGIRGIVGPGINPILAAQYGAAFAALLLENDTRKGAPLIVGRDSRPSGWALSGALIAGVVGAGLDVLDVGVVPTPTVAMAVIGLRARGGVCVTASHNSAEWNALKFFNKHGEFIDRATFENLETRLAKGNTPCLLHDQLGDVTSDDTWVNRHIAATLRIAGVSPDVVRRAKLRVVVDAVNGAGSTGLPTLLEKMGVKVVRLNCVADGNFPHEPEPTPKNLKQLSAAVRKTKAHLGMACDPDADRLALVDEKGRPIGEELTLALAVRQALSVRKGPVVINLSTSRATHDEVKARGCEVVYTKVGEANVVAEMRRLKSRIGGEGNGGVIYGPLHYGRDSFVAAALVLTLFAKVGGSFSALGNSVSKYYTLKDKVDLPSDFDTRLAAFEYRIKERFGEGRVDRRDGVRLDFPEGWAQLRKSNTEPIYRIIAETTQESLSQEVMRLARETFGNP